MEKDVQNILDAAAVMKVSFKALELRQALPKERYDAIASAANTFRWFEGIELSKLRAAFDKEYANELKHMNRIAKGGLKDEG